MCPRELGPDEDFLSLELDIDQKFEQRYQFTPSEFINNYNNVYSNKINAR